MDYHDRDYRAALEHFGKRKAVDMAMENLRAGALPRFWQIRNCMLIAYGSEDWDEAEKYRLGAEDVWKVAVKGAAKSDVAAQQTYALMRKDLDELCQVQKDTMPTAESELVAANEEYFAAETRAGEEVEHGEEDVEDIEERDDEGESYPGYAESHRPPQLEAIDILRLSLARDPLWRQLRNEEYTNGVEGEKDGKVEVNDIEKAQVGDSDVVKGEDVGKTNEHDQKQEREALKSKVDVESLSEGSAVKPEAPGLLSTAVQYFTDIVRMR